MDDETQIKINSGDDYIESLRDRGLDVWLFGEKVAEPVDHPIIRPSINAIAKTYDLAIERPELASVISPFTGERVSRFLHVCTSANDLVAQNKMQRKLGQLTGTCFQRCVGMDAFNSLYSVTFEMDQANATPYHERMRTFLTKMHRGNFVVGGAMTDVKGDRSKPPHQQDDPDMFLHISKRTAEGVYVTGAKAHQTGCINSHWMVVMPTMRLIAGDEDYAIVGAVPVERFTAYHRRSYVCKTGVGDVLIGAAAQVAEMNGVEKASHIKDKLVEMTHLNETIYGTGIASSYQGFATKSGAYICDDMLSNVCKHHVTKLPYEMARMSQDLAGGLVVTMPSEKELNHPEIGKLIRKYLQGKKDFTTEQRMRILRLIENMTLGRNAVGYLTESMHGAGSPQAQRIEIGRTMQLEYKKRLARVLAGVELEADKGEVSEELSGYFERVFRLPQAQASQ